MFDMHTHAAIAVPTYVASVLLSAGTSQVVTNVISSTMPAELKLPAKILTSVGGFAIGLLATQAVSDYVENTVTEITDAVNNVVIALKNEDSETPEA